jgi:glycosyltransferase involved in cell wall biosynthesis
MAINIYITSFFRIEMTLRAIELIYQRTDPGTFKIHIFDNGSDKSTQEVLFSLLHSKKIESLHLDNRNTGCLYNKGLFYLMNEETDKYFCVTDNDIYPPLLTPDWLSQMIAIMEKHPKLGMLAPQLPPQVLQGPLRLLDDIVLCKAVGNTFKIVRRKAFPMKEYKQKLGAYGDDGIISSMMQGNGWEVAFCRNIFCFHAGQCKNWGYTSEQVAMDPRKIGYGLPFVYKLENDERYEPESQYRL